VVPSEIQKWMRSSIHCSGLRPRAMPNATHPGGRGPSATGQILATYSSNTGQILVKYTGRSNSGHRTSRRPRPLGDGLLESPQQV
jgi:hypothetical protein